MTLEWILRLSLSRVSIEHGHNDDRTRTFSALAERRASRFLLSKSTLLVRASPVRYRRYFMKLLISALLLIVLVPSLASAESSDGPEIAACKATGILALKEKSPTVRDMILDMDTTIIAKADTEIEGIAIRTVVMGDVYLEKKGTGKAQHFLCLIGDKGKVLLTFFAGQ
jgi:hypothetical protein